MRIGLSQNILYQNGRIHDAIDHGWYKMLVNHTLFFLPNTINQNFDVIADSIDSFILTGGETTIVREQAEIALLNKMLERNKPIVGISQGALFIAERLGSTIQVIPNHNNVEHYIMYHGEAIKVNSNHETGITKLHPGGEILCLADTGEIEAFIDKNRAGIMWNPEKMKKPWIPPEIAYILRI